MQEVVAQYYGWLSGLADSINLPAFSFTFCLTLFWLFFGLTIPLAIASSAGLLFPGVFAMGTALPVLGLAALLASGVVNIRRVVKRFRAADVWLQRGVPETFFIPKDGTIRDVKTGPLQPPELEQRLEALLKEGES